MEKFKFDMAVMQKQHAKMKGLDNEGVDYDLSDMEIGDDEFDDEESRNFAKFLKARKEDKEKTKKEYDDEPYKAKEMEESHH